MCSLLKLHNITSSSDLSCVQDTEELHKRKYASPDQSDKGEKLEHQELNEGKQK